MALNPPPTVTDLANGDVIHEHADGSVWLYKGGNLEAAQHFESLAQAVAASNS